jgi:hypothetical protein
VILVYLSAVADNPTLPEAKGSARNESREESAVRVALGICLFLAGIGLIVGLITASARKVAPCENGHMFPEGTKDFNCYVHPQGGVGVAIALFSILLGTLVVFSSIPALATLRARAEARESTPDAGDS